MTNPAQLKYLEAMGIPVWVSRELIVEAVEGHTVEDTVDLAPKEHAKKNVSTNDSVVAKSAQGKKMSSAESLLKTLEDPTQRSSMKTAVSSKKPNTRPSKNSSTKPNTKASTNSTSPSQEAVRENEELRDVKQPLKSTNPQTDNSKHAENQIGQTAVHTVFASGSLNAEWMVIGQSPDVNDSVMYQPYPHESGELLNNMLKAVGIENPRAQTYWINTLKSSMRVENKEELAAAIELNQLLTEKIEQIKPNIILLVGQLAAQNLLQSKEPLARLRLQQQTEPLTLENSIPVVVTYYPSYLLSKPQDKAKTWKDLKLAMSLLATSKDE